MINIILVGPCGVGKSTIGRELACCRKMIYLDFDKLGILDMNRRRGERSPFSVSNLNFSECLPSIIPKVNNNYFILDIGGGTVFRENVNNFDRVQQLQWVKNKYNPKKIVLYANKEILSQRFFATRSFSEDSLNIIWNNWKKISEPNWKKIGDFFIDTSHLTINSTVEKINEILDQVDLKKMTFFPGLELNERYFSEIVRPLMKQYDASLRYSASLIGYGSDVLGYDNTTSMDHNWGPRMQIFVGKADVGRIESIKAYLRAHLPGEFMGFSTHFSEKGPDGTQKMQVHPSGEVNHLIDVFEIDGFFAEFLHKDASQLTHLDWLCIPEQRLVELTRGRVFYDGLGRLNEMRSALRYYPREVKLVKLAAYWECVANEEAFVGRAVEFGDLVGLKLLAARMVNTMLKTCFVLRETYVPYSKWFSRAFDELQLPEINALGLATLTDNEASRIETLVSELYMAVLALQNATAGVPRVERVITNYYNRPYKVIGAGEIVSALRAAITDEQLKAIDLTLVGLDNKLDSSDFTNADVLGRLLRD